MTSKQFFIFHKNSIDKIVDAGATYNMHGPNMSHNFNSPMRHVPEAEKLIGRRNYEQWKWMVELKLSANDLMECIENKNRDPSWTEKQRRFNDKTQSFINNSVSKNVQSTIWTMHFVGCASVNYFVNAILMENKIASISLKLMSS